MAWVGGVGAPQAAKEDWDTWVEEEEEGLLAYSGVGEGAVEPSCSGRCRLS